MAFKKNLYGFTSLGLAAALFHSFVRVSPPDRDVSLPVVLRAERHRGGHSGSGGCLLVPEAVVAIKAASPTPVLALRVS